MAASEVDEPGLARVTHQQRRETALEIIEIAVPAAWAVYVSGLLVARWQSATAAAWALVVAAVLAASWSWHRSRYPSRVSAPVPEHVRERPDRSDRSGDTRSIWAWDNLLLVVVMAVAMVVTVVVGLLVAFIFPLAVVLGFAVVVGGASGADVGLALLATLGVAIVVDVGVVHPLARHWGIPVDEPVRKKSDFCPPPLDGSR